MLNIQNVLFATDFSASARTAADHAVLLAQRHEAVLHVLHVAPLSRGKYSMKEGDDRLAGSIDVPAALPVTQTQKRSHSAADGIREYAEAQQIDLVVLGTRGQSGLRRLAMGSVAEAVVRQAACPVLTVRAREEAGEPGDAPHQIQRILAPVDFSDTSRRALLYARELAALYEAHVDLLHISAHADFHRGSGADVVYETPEEPVSRREREKARLASMAKGGKLEAKVHAVYGYPHGGILDFAEERGTDLIVIGTHGRSGMERVLLGSVAERVIRQAPCPVFTVKSFGTSLLTNEPEEQPAEASPGEATP